MNSLRKLTYPYVGWMALFIAVPTFLILLYAFTAQGNDVVSIQFTLDNFRKFLDPLFISILWKSLVIAFQPTILCLLLGYPVAFVISRMNQKHQLLMMLLITMPTWINMLIRTYAWISLLSDHGIINNILSMLGIGPLKMMYTDFAVVLGMVYNFLPFMILSIYTRLARLDNSLIDASYDLGDDRFMTFRKVIFPLSIPAVLW